MSINVRWTLGERHFLVVRAADIQAERPGLTGVALLRHAVLALPKGRHRRVESLNRHEWFMEGLSEELRQRATKLLQVEHGELHQQKLAELRNMSAGTAKINEHEASIEAEVAQHALDTKAHFERTAAWQGEVAQAGQSMITLLCLVLANLRTINMHLLARPAAGDDAHPGRAERRRQRLSPNESRIIDGTGNLKEGELN